MTIEEIFNKEQAKDIIAELKNGREVPAPDVDAAKKALNPDLHDVNNPLIRKDKRVKVDVDEDSGDKVIEMSGGESISMRIEKVARIRLAIQKLIIKRAVSFLFGNNVAYNSDAESEQEKAVMKAFNRILRDVKIGTIDRQVGRTIFGFKERKYGSRSRSQAALLRDTDSLQSISFVARCFRQKKGTSSSRILTKQAT